MKQLASILAFAGLAIFATPAVRADVKTRVRTITRINTEGYLGATVAMQLGGSLRNDSGADITTTMAAKGRRFFQIDDQSGTIVDFAETRVYKLDVASKEFTLTTFEEMRREATTPGPGMPPPLSPAERQRIQTAEQQYSVTAVVKETNQHRTICGYDVREVILTHTAHDRSRPGAAADFVLTTDVWLAASIPALDELSELRRTLAKTILQSEGMLIDYNRQVGAAMGYFWLAPLMASVDDELRKLHATPLMNTFSLEGGPVVGESPSRRMTILTVTQEFLSVNTATSASDVAMPAGFKQKK